MSLTAVIWLSGVGVLSLATLFRAPYGFSLYLLTFYLFPAFWWWGDALPNLRWNLLAALIFAVGVAFQAMRSPTEPSPPQARRVGTVAIVIAVNATLVHVLFAPSMAISLGNYVLLLKFVALFFLIATCARNPSDFRLLLWSIVLGAAYLGFEVTINDRGRFISGRLEGVGAAGAANANELASLMATVLPIAGALFFWGSWKEKLLVAVTGPLILNVVLLCSSRGALLALVGGAAVFLATTTGALRKRAMMGLALAGVAAFLLLGDPDILARFGTTFDPAEKRDDSAAGRLVLWRAGMMMLADHPLGGGGDGFKAGYGGRYLPAVGIDRMARSVHNGLLNEACEWGIQGFVMRMLFIGLAIIAARRTIRALSAADRTAEAAVGCCLIASATTFLVSCLFGDYLDNEWGYWVPALMVAYARVYASNAETASAAARSQGRVMVVPGAKAAPAHARASTTGA